MRIFARDGNESGIRTWKDEHTKLFLVGVNKLPYVSADKYMLTLHLFWRAFQIVVWRDY